MREGARKDVGRMDASANSVERFHARMDVQAAKLLETVLRRQRWTVGDRDKVAEFLGRVVKAELKAERLGGGGEDE